MVDMTARKWRWSIEKYLVPLRDPPPDRSVLTAHPCRREMKMTCPQWSGLLRLHPSRLKTMGISKWSRLGLSQPGVRLTPSGATPTGASPGGSRGQL